MKRKVEQMAQQGQPCCHVKIKTQEPTDTDEDTGKINGSLKVVSAVDGLSRDTCTPTSTTAMTAFVTGGIAVVLVETFGGSSSLRVVLY